jgi:hypothetical protein
MIKGLERLKNTDNKYMADLRPDRLMPYQSERKLVVSRRPGVLSTDLTPHFLSRYLSPTCAFNLKLGNYKPAWIGTGFEKDGALKKF